MTKAIRIPPCSTCGVTRRIKLPWRRCTWASNGAGSVNESIAAAAAAIGRDDEKRADLTRGKRRGLVAMEVALNRLCELSIHSSERIGGRGDENKPRVEIATPCFFHAPPVGPSSAFPAAPAGSLVVSERSQRAQNSGKAMAEAPTSPHDVLEALQLSLASDPNALDHARLVLGQWARAPRFYTYLVDVFTSREGVQLDVRLQAALQFKNGVEKYWRKGALQCVFFSLSVTRIDRL